MLSQKGQSLAEFGLAMAIIVILALVVVYAIYAFVTIFIPWFGSIVVAAQAGSSVAIAIACWGPAGLIILVAVFILAIRALAVAQERNRLIEMQAGKPSVAK